MSHYRVVGVLAGGSQLSVLGEPVSKLLIRATGILNFQSVEINLMVICLHRNKHLVINGFEVKHNKPVNSKIWVNGFKLKIFK